MKTTGILFMPLVMLHLCPNVIRVCPKDARHLVGLEFYGLGMRRKDLDIVNPMFALGLFF